MKQVLRKILASQWENGQFPTLIQSKDIPWRTVSTLTPTYLIVLILMKLREHKEGCPEIDEIITKGAQYIAKQMITDPIEGWRVWHFNAFYQPDFEETCWCAYILIKNGLATKKDFQPLLTLINANSTASGVGV